MTPDAEHDPSPTVGRIRALLDAIWSNVTFDGVAESVAEAVVALAHRPAARVALDRSDSSTKIVATVGTWDAGRRLLPRIFGESREVRDWTLRDKAGFELGTLSMPPLDDADASSLDELEAEALLTAQAGLAAGYIRLQDRANRFEQEATTARDEAYVLRSAWQIAIDEAPNGMAVVGLSRSNHGRLLQANDALARMTGLDARELLETPLLHLFAKDDRGRVADSLRRATEGGRTPTTRLGHIVTASAELRRVRIITTPVHNLEHVAEFAVCHIEQLEAQAPEVAGDPLTRTDADELFARITRAIKDARRYDARTALMLCDLSDLDRLLAAGDDMGSKDQIVNELIMRLRSAVREDDAVGQLDDHSLSLLLSDTSSGDAVTVAERVRAILREVALEHGHTIGPQVGITMIDSASDPTSSVSAATAAMRAARTSSTRISLYPGATGQGSCSSGPTYIIRNRRRRGGLRT